MGREEHTDEIDLVREAWKVVRIEWQQRTSWGKVLFPVWLYLAILWWGLLAFFLFVAHVHARYRGRGR